MLWFGAHQQATSSETQIRQSRCAWDGCLREDHERMLTLISVQSDGSSYAPMVVAIQAVSAGTTVVVPQEDGWRSLNSSANLASTGIPSAASSSPSDANTSVKGSSANGPLLESDVKLRVTHPDCQGAVRLCIEGGGGDRQNIRVRYGLDCSAARGAPAKPA